MPFRIVLPLAVLAFAAGACSSGDGDYAPNGQAAYSPARKA